MGHQGNRDQIGCSSGQRSDHCTLLVVGFDSRLSRPSPSHRQEIKDCLTSKYTATDNVKSIQNSIFFIFGFFSKPSFLPYSTPLTTPPSPAPPVVIRQEHPRCLRNLEWIRRTPRGQGFGFHVLRDVCPGDAGQLESSPLRGVGSQPFSA